MRKLHQSVYPPDIAAADKENSTSNQNKAINAEEDETTVNKATGQPRKKNFLEKRMFGDYG